MQLEQGGVHLWLVDLNTIDPALIPHYCCLMTGEELARNQRYRLAEGRFADCVTRALVRTVLSRYARVDPGDWCFGKGEHGKPWIGTPVPGLPLHFNLSHTKRFVVCGVALGHDLGVDIENIMRRSAVLDIAEDYFSPREVKDLFALPAGQHRDRFFDYWTLKEAFMKATGEGISLGLENFGFTIFPDGEIEIHFNDSLGEEPEEWHFRLYSLTDDHRLAVALRAGRSANIGVRLFETVPLVEEFIERDIRFT